MHIQYLSPYVWLIKIHGKKSKTLETTQAELLVDNNPNLPPLMNPAMLEASEDLTNLSHLNEPAGRCLYIPLLSNRTDLFLLKFYRLSSYAMHKKRYIHTAALCSLQPIPLQGWTHSMSRKWCRCMLVNIEHHRHLISSRSLRKHLRKNTNLSVVFV